MVFPYPEFHGKNDESVEEFLEKMEVACISNHIQEPAQLLHLLQLCLKGDARIWSKAYEEQLGREDPPVAISWDNLREALAEEFERTKDPDKVWHEVQELKQRDNEVVEGYIKTFSMLWESLCKALQPQIAPPDMMKKDRFLAGLQDGL